MITGDNLALVEREMRRLQLAIDAHRNRVANDEHYADRFRIVGGSETAAIRRASLDLSRALSRLRSR